MSPPPFQNDGAMSRLISLADSELYVFDEGAGAPLLFVHGFPLDHAMWHSQLDEFSKTNRVIAPDLRGFGQSEDTPGTVTMEQFADDLAEILEQLRINEPVTLCGLSMGGYIAWQFWKRHPQRLARLILCDTKALPDTPAARETRMSTAEKVLRTGMESLADSMPEKLFCAETHAHNSKLIDAAKRTMMGNSPVGIAAALRGMAARPDVTSWLPEMQIPALLLVGEEDVVSPVGEMTAIAAAMPQATLTVIPRAGHMSPQEQPGLVNQAIRSFIG